MQRLTIAVLPKPFHIATHTYYICMACADKWKRPLTLQALTNPGPTQLPEELRS